MEKLCVDCAVFTVNIGTMFNGLGSLKNSHVMLTTLLTSVGRYDRQLEILGDLPIQRRPHAYLPGVASNEQQVTGDVASRDCVVDHGVHSAIGIGGSNL